LAFIQPPISFINNKTLNQYIPTISTCKAFGELRAAPTVVEVDLKQARQVVLFCVLGGGGSGNGYMLCVCVWWW
jgi:hypothetical protein